MTHKQISNLVDFQRNRPDKQPEDEWILRVLLKEQRRLSPKPVNIPFKTWWELYDKKVDRFKCEKRWSRLTDDERDNAVTHTPEYVKSTPDKIYRKNPLTYLNSKSWENEIIKKEEPKPEPTRKSVWA